MTIFDQMLLRGMAPNSEAVARASSGGTFGGPGITQNQGGQAAPQNDMGAGLPAQAGFASTPNDPYAPWMRPDIAPHTQNILPLMQPLEQEGYRQLQETYGPDAPTPQELNPLVFRGFGAQPFSPMNFPNQYNIPKYGHDMGVQQNIDAGEQFWDFAGQEPFAEYQSLAPFAGGALATGGSGQTMGTMPARSAGGPARSAGLPAQAGGQAGGQMPVGLGGGAPTGQPQGGASLRPTPGPGANIDFSQFQGQGTLGGEFDPNAIIRGDPETSRAIAQFAPQAPGEFGEILSSWQGTQHPTLRINQYNIAKSLYDTLQQPGGLERTRERWMGSLQPVDSPYGRVLTVGGTNPDTNILGGRANQPREEELVGGTVDLQQKGYRAVLGDELYNQLLGG